jgi:hypothetical protein
VLMRRSVGSVGKCWKCREVLRRSVIVIGCGVELRSGGIWSECSDKDDVNRSMGE